MYNTKIVYDLRKETGISITACQKAAKEANGDIVKAREILKKNGYDFAEQVKDKQTSEGLIYSYIHHNNKVGSIVEIRCQTDFCAMSLHEFAKQICMQICATNPEFISEKSVPTERIAQEKIKIFDELESLGKEEEEIGSIIKGKMRRFYFEHCLLCQKSIQNSLLTVRDMLNEKIRQTGENIEIVRFCRYQVGN